MVELEECSLKVLAVEKKRVDKIQIIKKEAKKDEDL